MPDEHNPKRYGELWPQHRIDAQMATLTLIRPYVALSGGWAWHFLSPPGHPEYKHAHDHKDMDLMVPPKHVAAVLGLLQGQQYKKVRTRFDRLPSAEDFRRYEAIWFEDLPDTPTVRLTIDFFVRDVPIREIPSENRNEPWRVVEPETLLTFYSTFHSSKSCFAVQAAKRLLDQGIDPMGHPSLVEIPGGPG